MLIKHPEQQARRDLMRTLSICINGSLPAQYWKRPTGSRKPGVEHGPVVKAGKCQRCLDVHAMSRRPR